MKNLFFAIIISALIVPYLPSCQRKTSKTDADTINEAMEHLDNGRAQKAIDTLTPLTAHNKSPKVMSLMASAYLYRSHISTREIIDLFLNFSVQNEKTAEPQNENLKEFTQMVSALDNFFLKLAVVPPIENKEQETDLNTALFYLKSAKPSTPGIALQRGLIRLILAKYIFTNTVESIFKPNAEDKCEFAWSGFYRNLEDLLKVSADIVSDLNEASPKKASVWNSSLESINNIQNKINAVKDKEQPVDPLAQDLFIYFLKSHSIDVGCSP
jgi:hypothetical protein